MFVATDWVFLARNGPGRKGKGRLWMQSLGKPVIYVISVFFLGLLSALPTEFQSRRTRKKCPKRLNRESNAFGGGTGDRTSPPAAEAVRIAAALSEAFKKFSAFGLSRKRPSEQSP